MPLTDVLLALASGLALAGLLSSAQEALTGRRTDFALLETGDWWALAAVPLVTFGGPFILIRNVVNRPRNLAASVSRAFGAAFLSGAWSLMIGVVLLDLVSRAAR